MAIFPYSIPFTVTAHSALNPSRDAVTVVLPMLSAVTFPSSMVATSVLELDQVISPRGVASAGIMDAVNVSVFSSGISSVVLSRLIPVTGLSTSMSHEADFPYTVAVIFAVPFPTVVILPSAMVATASSEEVQDIGSFKVASAGVRVAVRVSVSPIYNVNLSLFRDIPDIGVRTTILASAVLSPALAVIVASPFLTAFTLPDSTVAMELSDEVQTIVLSVASSGRTVVVNVSSSPSYRVSSVLSSLTSVTAIAAFTTDTLHSPFFPSAAAVIVVVPSLRAVTSPAALIDATEGLELDQVISLLVAPVGVTVALSCKVFPISNSAEGILMVTDSTRISCSFSVQEKNAGKMMSKRRAMRLFMVQRSLSYCKYTEYSENN